MPAANENLRSAMEKVAAGKYKDRNKIVKELLQEFIGLYDIAGSWLYIFMPEQTKSIKETERIGS